MSGIDEQIRDFPKCSACKRHTYWIGRRKESSIRSDDIFFNPLSFRGSGGRPTPVYDGPESRMARVEELKEVIGIRCDGCRQDVDEAIFSQIIYAAKRLIREWESEHVGYR